RAGRWPPHRGAFGSAAAARDRGHTLPDRYSRSRCFRSRARMRARRGAVLPLWIQDEAPPCSIIMGGGWVRGLTQITRRLKCPEPPNAGRTVMSPNPEPTFRRYSEATVPTEYGTFRFVVYR